uniref:Putative nucleotidyltransferase MAB21L1 n=7 Tax=Amniota TaxID=32524 RepID=A0A8B9Y705_BOSMU
MIAAQAKLVYHLNKYYNEKCQARKAAIAKTIREVCKVVSDVLKEVEVQEPRFISSLNEMDNRYEGLEVISPTEFEVVLYLNQMGVFNFVDDGSLPGCAVLKLSDGRKRSMSLWVEFITASGYLSARKIRSRFQTLVAQAVDKCSYRDVVKMVADTSEVKLRIRDRYVVQITPAFKCTGIWPRSAAHWPLPHIPWPGPNRVAEVKAEGFNLLSKECHSLAGKQSSAESDAWVLQFAEAENRLWGVQLCGRRLAAGCAVLKLSDGRKRSMSLWVEFITASGYLSARKIRSRFQTLVAQAVDKCSYRDVVKMVADTSEVKLRIRDRYVVQITPAFKCTGIWPRSAAHWPLPHIPWPGPNRVAEVKAEGFNLLSKECHSLAGKQSSAESDAWVLQFAEAENRLQMGGCRKKCLSILKTLRDRHLELPGQPLNNYHMKTLVSYECEKHPRESDWDESCLGDRLNGILLQLISCLQCRRCPHYFLPNLDLFQGKPHSALENAAKQTWRLAREILTNPKSLEKL